MSARALGMFLIWLGVGATILGLLLLSGALSWFGRLPGDIRVEGEQTRIYFPITSMLLISAAVTLVANLIRRVL
ncbi:MAG: DUF2905 domain-containing protein [Actinomycetota bacterium]